MVRFLYRLLINLLKLIFICLPLELVGILILAPVCLMSTSYRLPKILRWFDNADMYVGRDTSTYLKVVDSGWIPRYLWLSLRNPINYFGYTVLGVCPQTSLEARSETISDSPIGDTSSPGLYRCEAMIDGKSYYEYYLIFVYTFSPDHCFRFRMGHKLQKFVDNKIGSSIQWVMCVQPWKAYSGKKT